MTRRNHKRRDRNAPDHYVYALVDPRNGEQFYYGKGVGERCHHHVREWRGSRRTAKTNWEKLDRIGAIIEAGHEVGIAILAEGLTEGEAFGVEFKRIRDAVKAGRCITNLFGTSYAGWQRVRLTYALKLVTQELRRHPSKAAFCAKVAELYGRSSPTRVEHRLWLRELGQLATVRRSIHAQIAAIRDAHSHART